MLIAEMKEWDGWYGSKVSHRNQNETLPQGLFPLLPAEWGILDRMFPPGGLIPFLQRNPETFNYYGTAPSGKGVVFDLVGTGRAGAAGVSATARWWTKWSDNGYNRRWPDHGYGRAGTRGYQ